MSDYSWSDGTSCYVWGAELITNGSVYYVYNAHGDVIHLLNASGAVTKTYDYDAYGNELSRDLNDSNPFRYCGEYYDTETGFIYLRARYYDPTVGRFISQDPHWNVGNMIYGDNPDEDNPIPEIGAIIQIGNLYVYCMNNPLQYRDYSGKSVVLTMALIGMGLGALLGGLYGNHVAKGKGYTSSDGWNYYKYVLGYGTGGAIAGGIIGGTLGWASQYIFTSSTITWVSYKATTAIGSSSYAIGRAFEEWFYKAYHVVDQQVKYAGYRFDAIYQNNIIELKNYDWSKYSSYGGLAGKFANQASNYMRFIGETINGQQINGVTFCFSSQPPEIIVRVLERIGVTVVRVSWEGENYVSSI